jgi:hypothetical protein
MTWSGASEDIFSSIRTVIEGGIMTKLLSNIPCSLGERAIILHHGGHLRLRDMKVADCLIKEGDKDIEVTVFKVPCAASMRKKIHNVRVCFKTHNGQLLKVPSYCECERGVGICSHKLALLSFLHIVKVKQKDGWDCMQDFIAFLPDDVFTLSTQLIPFVYYKC